MKPSYYVALMLSATEDDAWGIGYDMIYDDDVSSMLLQIYRSNMDPCVTFSDTLHEFVIELMKDDRKVLRNIKNKNAVTRWIKTCYRNTLWHCNQKYLHSLAAYKSSMESIIHAKKYEIDDRTWVFM